METKKFKIKGGEKTKGGKFLNQQFIAAVGAATIGGFSAGAGYAAMVGAGKKGNEEDKPITGQSDEQAVSSTVAETAPSKPQEPTSAQPQQPVDEYQPTDSAHPATEPQQTVTEPTQPVPTQEEVDPNLVAEAIAHEVDQQDIDSENVLTIDQIGTVNGPDGSEMMAVVGHLPDGTLLLLTDIDGDGIFSDVFDMEGNYAGLLEGNLTAGDLIEMYDDSGNYLAMTEEIAGDDPVNGITDTEPAHEESAMAQLEQSTEEQSSDEELLAQLTDEIDDEDSLLDRLVDELPGDDEEEESEELEESDDTTEEIDGGLEDA